MITIQGRVRSTVRLRQSEVDAPCVVATSWASDRAFPRTVGVGVPFEIETAAGQVFRVDPFGALLALPVRRRERADGVSREYAWLGPADEITIEGEVDPEELDQPPALHALRIAVPAPPAGDVHRVPPRSLRTGECDETHAASETAPVEVAAAPKRRKAKKQPEPAAPLPDPLPAERGEGDEER